MASALDMRDRQQQLSYDDMMDAIHRHVIEKDRPPSERDPSIIIVTHEQFVSLAQLRRSTGEYGVTPQSRRCGPSTFAGVPLWIRESQADEPPKRPAPLAMVPTISRAEAYRVYADALRRSVAELTEAEKQTALLNHVMDKQEGQA